MADTWFRVVLGDPLVEADPFHQLRKLLEERGLDSAHEVLIGLESASVHCVAVAYLPASMRELAAELNGTQVSLGAGLEWLTPLAQR